MYNVYLLECSTYCIILITGVSDLWVCYANKDHRQCHPRSRYHCLNCLFSVCKLKFKFIFMLRRNDTQKRHMLKFFTLVITFSVGFSSFNLGIVHIYNALGVGGSFEFCYNVL